MATNELINKLKDRIAESKTVLQSILSDLKDGSVGKILVENEIKYITQLESEIALESQAKEPSDEELMDYSEIKTLLKKGLRLAAIKKYYETFGGSLKDSKIICDELYYKMKANDHK